jgi:hypothetical protein
MRGELCHLREADIPSRLKVFIKTNRRLFGRSQENAFSRLILEDRVVESSTTPRRRKSTSSSCLICAPPSFGDQSIAATGHQMLRSLPTCRAAFSSLHARWTAAGVLDCRGPVLQDRICDVLFGHRMSTETALQPQQVWLRTRSRCRRIPPLHRDGA